MKLHIIGICGTFMGGVARLARDLGHIVTGSDANTYPPMSTQLESLGITLYEGFAAEQIDHDIDIVVVGNSISRGNPELEHVLERGLRYTSGAQWLGEHVLQDRWVLAVAGTHGKTTTSSMLAWILDQNDLAPGYLIGGVPENFGQSARLGNTPFFVIEADEYDTAFSDKRSKFVHYRPRTLVLNNLEFDHADIFADLHAIQTQVHHLIKTIPSQGQIIHNRHTPALDELLKWGVWSETARFGSSDAEWVASKTSDDGSRFEINHKGSAHAVAWDLIGDHNVMNALAAVAAAHHVGIRVEHAVESLSTFKSVKRRMEKIYDNNGIRIFDDFAHHPTAIKTTLEGLRHQVGKQAIIAVLEPRSNTMKQGIHKHLLSDALSAADACFLYANGDVNWDISELENEQISTHHTVDSLLEALISKTTQLGDQAINVVVMSNGGFENLHQRLISKLPTPC
ncbi:UDP-N-acetylmuramate:L-alanyl-gamma-D-glutamyl-meso-diaminopimelate ligase [Arenicella xantha]|uniref:UDP-N-acetylmuramate--L-alanyl-gamma-D-glutamyl-meso-2,6-diaminoheptandioate ligase n=1 Tax=Arenicella xantha TaxID=644221 RepID=A0A395JJZ7_9GAMM|nr:UDP-N-acetylmuramate:L-alanyl-gamma-D-glutamyl-meso-diaminopimelate ligase [Arenicella xantha]RBP50849.1 UDP-N-acetylmuramate: L-alanyl-gamma-D-glutamyl-meso-diaminopimelate ligase [Arenicella xantha]